MKFEEFYRGMRISFSAEKAFADQGINTPYQRRALIELYNQKEGKVSRQALKNIVGVENEGYFTSEVLNPLKDLGYVEIYKGKSSMHGFLFVRLTSTGESVVEEVIGNLEQKLAGSD